ncbi:hypothetical protein [Jeotgalibaca caeni]|uniref:glycoside hydrolase family 38 N-terminal domain-containing protein n=1 Tax=Jeotgalibaca caeni TaxID=3028623 RepID=UPI00237D8669|nr:hypothetical protein [Jeotgalibaca caeni]MDE1549307.1 hypothetical protein [Jeotgalibaca caeni]
MKKIANCIHHTHWDLIWYFTVQDASVQFSYNMKELLDAFDNREVENFFLDGQTAPIDEYLTLFPNERKRVEKYVSSGQLVIGPFNSQLDSFITSGESVLNNLRLGIKTARQLGRVSKTAYLPDSFGHSIDYPKIFKQFDIEDFVITRGVGDEYNLGSEFYLESNDGSRLLVYTMIAGYGYGAYSFKEGTLFTNQAVDYNKINVHQLIDRLLTYSTIENEFVFPLGFDQNPMVRDIKEKIAFYNASQKEFEFVETTWQKFFQKIREKGQGLKIHQHELISPQYHRVHRSIYSARADVKALQDQCERVLTYELQPMMSMLDSLGIEYNHGLVDKAWETLILCQTHSSANLTEETNAYIERQTKNSLNLAYSHKQYLLKLLSLSLNDEGSTDSPLIVMSTLPQMHTEVVQAKIFTKTSNFSLYLNDEKVPYTILHAERKNNGVLRKNPLLINEEKFYYVTDIEFEAKDLPGISYRTYQVREEQQTEYGQMVPTSHYIENENYKIFQNEKGIAIYDKINQRLHERAFLIEDAGDEGDSFDYSYPTHDWKITDSLDQASVEYSSSMFSQKMTIRGSMNIPFNLEERKNKEATSILEYTIQLVVEKNSPMVKLSGKFHNQAEQHRVRLLFTGEEANEYSFAGTQYSVLKRKTFSEEQTNWKEKGYFEEPSPIYPLLNHVSTVHNQQVMTIYTRGSKEYEFVNEGYKDIGVTIFRSYGALGYPDLNRRPGRPSGLDYMVFETPSCQMKRENHFELAVSYATDFSPNGIFKQYVTYATNSSVYQKQTYDKSIHPIDYFPTNPMKEKVPNNYHFLQLEDGEEVFGTIVKSDLSDSYIVRVFNNEDREVNLGTLEGQATNYPIYQTNMEETKKESLDKKLQKGELRMIKLEKGRE